MSAPRNRLDSLPKRAEAGRTVVYLSSGPDPDRDGGQLVYVGEADNVACRLPSTGARAFLIPTRTNESLVTFGSSFSLSSIDGPQPPGAYQLVVDEEEVPGLPFLAYRRTTTRLHLPAAFAATQIRQVISVDPS